MVTHFLTLTVAIIMAIPMYREQYVHSIQPVQVYESARTLLNVFLAHGHPRSKHCKLCNIHILCMVISGMIWNIALRSDSIDKIWSELNYSVADMLFVC